ncbi:hypothetical protein [Burkholderia sp. PU8-34]
MNTRSAKSPDVILRNGRFTTWGATGNDAGKPLQRVAAQMCGCASP